MQIQIQNQNQNQLTIKRSSKYEIEVTIQKQVKVNARRYQEVDVTFEEHLQFDDIKDFVNKLMAGIEIPSGYENITIIPKPDEITITDDMITITNEELIYLVLRYIVARRYAYHEMAVEWIMEYELKLVDIEWIRRMLDLMLISLTAKKYNDIESLAYDVMHIVNDAIAAVKFMLMMMQKQWKQKIENRESKDEKQEGDAALNKIESNDEKQEGDAALNKIESNDENPSIQDGNVNQEGLVQKDPLVGVYRLNNKIYVKYKDVRFYLKNVEWDEISESLKNIINRYDSGIRYVSLRNELTAFGKIVIDEYEIAIYEVPYQGIVKDFILYLIARVAEDDEDAYFITMKLDDKAKEFIIYLLEKQNYEVKEDQLKRIYRVMETTFRVLNPGYTKYRIHNKDEY